MDYNTHARMFETMSGTFAATSAPAALNRALTSVQETIHPSSINDRLFDSACYCLCDSKVAEGLTGSLLTKFKILTEALTYIA